jgi:hypothetical protein
MTKNATRRPGRRAAYRTKIERERPNPRAAPETAPSRSCEDIGALLTGAALSEDKRASSSARSARPDSDARALIPRISVAAASRNAWRRAGCRRSRSSNTSADFGSLTETCRRPCAIGPVRPDMQVVHSSYIECGTSRNCHNFSGRYGVVTKDLVNFQGRASNHNGLMDMPKF